MSNHHPGLKGQGQTGQPSNDSSNRDELVDELENREWICIHGLVLQDENQPSPGLLRRAIRIILFWLLLPTEMLKIPICLVFLLGWTICAGWRLLRPLPPSRDQISNQFRIFLLKRTCGFFLFLLLFSSLLYTLTIKTFDKAAFLQRKIDRAEPPPSVSVVLDITQNTSTKVQEKGSKTKNDPAGLSRRNKNLVINGARPLSDFPAEAWTNPVQGPSTEAQIKEEIKEEVQDTPSKPTDKLDRGSLPFDVVDGNKSDMPVSEECAASLKGEKFDYAPLTSSRPPPKGDATPISTTVLALFIVVGLRRLLCCQRSAQEASFGSCFGTRRSVKNEMLNDEQAVNMASETLPFFQATLSAPETGSSEATSPRFVHVYPHPQCSLSSIKSDVEDGDGAEDEDVEDVDGAEDDVEEVDGEEDDAEDRDRDGEEDDAEDRDGEEDDVEKNEDG